MLVRQRRGLCYNCNEKYACGHKCKEQKLFQIDVASPSPSEDITIEETLEYEVVDHTSSM